MDLTTDKLRSLVRKWQTLIEAHVDIRTTDGYSVRLFAIGFTKKHKDHVKKTAYASASQCRAIRKKMKEVMNKETSGVDLHQLVDKLMIESVGKEIEKHTQAIYPLQNCLIRKVKMLRAPKVDVQKLVEAAGGAEVLAKATGQMFKAAAPTVAAPAAEDTGVKVASKKPAKADAAADTKADAKADAKAADKSATPAAAKDDKKAAAPKEDKKKDDKKKDDKKKDDKKAAAAKPPKEDKKGGDKKGDDKKAKK